MPRRPGPNSDRVIARGVKRDTKKAANASKTAEALAMRRKGASLQDIGDALFNGDKSNAHRSIRRAIANMVDDETVEAVRKREIGLLDEMEAGFYDAAIGGDKDAGLVMLKIQAQRSALLGLDAPKKTETKGEIDVTVNRMSDAADAVRKKLAGLDK